MWKAKQELGVSSGWSKRGSESGDAAPSQIGSGGDAGGFGGVGGLGGYSGGLGDMGDAGKLGSEMGDGGDGGDEGDVAQRIEGRQLEMRDMMNRLLRRPKKDDDKKRADKGSSITNILAHVSEPRLRVKRGRKTATKRRTKAVSDAKRQTITAARKRYNALKKAILKALREGKKRAYDTQNSKIKQMSPKQRKAARAKVRTELKQKLDRLLQDIKPASYYKRVDMIEGAIQVLRKLKW
jgi:hypothetical protein